MSNLWYPALTYASDQTGIAHLTRIGGQVLATRCGARPRQLGGGFPTAEEAGCRPCPRCAAIAAKAGA